ncbi:MAG: glutaredoxin domain-containing protein [Candidatus Omnitrophota bacterium]|nr:glutaredoxin domain-containing protein [Candidatus Omnitrophota bacterium]
MPKVKVYSTSTCSYCAMTKEFLKKNNIQFENIDVGIDRKASQEMVDLSDQMGVPVLNIDGQIIVGFDKDAISKALGI